MMLKEEKEFIRRGLNLNYYNKQKRDKLFVKMMKVEIAIKEIESELNNVKNRNSN